MKTEREAGEGNDPGTMDTIDVAAIQQALDAMSDHTTLPERLERASQLFIGRPYLQNPLQGSKEEPEVFTARLDAFDCVTYMETVLALAQSQTPEAFIDQLRRIRYEGGRVDWSSRNHYMVDWMLQNEKNGFLVNLTEGPETIEKVRELSVIDELPQKQVAFKCYPKKKLAAVSGKIETGDLIVFMTVKPTLDAFHTGVLTWRGNKLLLRHATRSVGSVIEERLANFLSAHRMSGFILLRPLDGRADAQPELT